MNIRYFNKLRELLPEPVRQFGGLVSLTLLVIFSFAILNIFFGQGDELVEKMKKEEARIVEANKLSKIISTLPSGILTFYEGSDHYKLTEKQYEHIMVSWILNLTSKSEADNHESSDTGV